MPRAAPERDAGGHFVVNGRQAVLIARGLNLAPKQLGSGITRIQPGEILARRQPEELGQAEISDENVVVIEEDIPRIEAKMLDAMLYKDVRQGLGDGQEITQQFVAWNAGEAFATAILKMVAEARFWRARSAITSPAGECSARSSIVAAGADVAAPANGQSLPRSSGLPEE